MSAPIPVAITDVLETVNLPTDTIPETLFQSHQDMVLRWLRVNTLDEAYLAATDENNEDAEVAAAFKFAYSLVILASTLEFLNLKTTGTGIIKATGIDAQAQALLSGGEIKDFKRELYLRALETLAGSDFLNDDGERLYSSMRPTQRSVRVTLI